MASTVKVGITAEDQGFKSTMDSMKSSANSFGQSLDTAGGKTKTLNGALREAKKEAMNLAMAYNQLSDAAKSSDFGVQMKKQLDMALQAAGQLQDIKGDVAAEISNLASDTMAWDATAQGIGVVSSGLQGLASAYGIVGGNVEKFAQALVTVNAVQSVANTIIGIGNALQKQSALMVGLRAAKNALFGASEVAATTAETANTAATAANTVATGANTAAKGANAAANTGQTAALGAATTAQLANNAAVLANPYVACAAAIVALTAAIVAWSVASQEATQEQLSLEAATEAYEKELDSSMKQAGDQISTFMSLKKTYDESGGQVDVLKKKIIDNTEAQRKLGVVVKTVDDVHKLFGKNSKAYCDYAYARARAMAAEAAQAAILGEILAELTKVQAKMMRGEEVDYVDFENILKKGGLNSATINRIVKEAGGGVEWDYIWSNLDAKNMDWGKVFKLSVDEMFKNGALKITQDILDDASKDISTSEADLGKLLESNNKKLKDSGKHHDKNGQSVKKVLTSLEGCDAIISDAEKEMKKLDSTSANYAKDMENLKNIILTARIAKLQLIDKSTIEGLSQSKSLIEQIIKSLPQGSDEFEKMNVVLSDVNTKLYGMYAALAQNGDIKSLKNAQSQIDNIINELPEGSDELQKWVNIWTQINDKILDADQKIKDLKEGLQEGSKTWIEREIKQLQSDIDKLDPNVEGNLSLIWDKELQISDLQRQLGALNELKSGVNVEAEVPIDITFDYKKSPLEIIQRDIEAYKSRLNELKQIKETDVSGETFDKIQEQISDLNHKLGDLNKQAVFAELTDDIKEMNSELANSSYDSLRGMTDVFKNLYSTIVELPDKLDDCANGFEGFFAIMEAGFSLIDSIVSFVEGIQKIIDIVKMLTTAKQALNVVEAAGTGTKLAEAGAVQAQVVAQGEKTASDAAETTSATAKAVALKAETTALLDAAAAEIFAAHAYIPFTGPGIAAGLIAGMLDEMAAVKAATLSMQAFAEGGIVGGNQYHGDKIIARLSSGEMVLNRAQQSNLFNMINSGEIESNVGGDNISVSSVRIKGSDLVLAIKNYQKVSGKKLFS